MATEFLLFFFPEIGQKFESAKLNPQTFKMSVKSPGVSILYMYTSCMSTALICMPETDAARYCYTFIQLACLKNTLFSFSRVIQVWVSKVVAGLLPLSTVTKLAFIVVRATYRLLVWFPFPWTEATNWEDRNTRRGVNNIWKGRAQES